MNGREPEQRRNYGYGRRLDYAGEQVLHAKFPRGNYGTVATYSARWHRFAMFAIHAGVPDMRRIDADLLRRFDATLKAQGKSIADRHNCLTAANTILSFASCGQWTRVSPVAITGQRRSEVRKAAPHSLDLERHGAATTWMRSQGMDRAAAIADLARTFGARSKECILADLGLWKRQADSLGRIDVRSGTKGGRGRHVARWVTVTAAGQAALNLALAARPPGSSNLLSPTERYADALSHGKEKGWVRTGREAYAAIIGARGFHDARAAYACERYRALTGCAAPCVIGTRVADRQLDRAGRMTLTQELGHNREDVVAAYVGSAR